MTIYARNDVPTGWVCVDGLGLLLAVGDEMEVAVPSNFMSASGSVGVKPESKQLTREATDSAERVNLVVYVEEEPSWAAKQEGFWTSWLDNTQRA